MARALETRMPRGGSDYPVGEGTFDEAFTAPGEPRPLYRPVLDALADRDLRSVAADVRERVESAGLDFGEDGFPVDAVPRLIGGEEWDRLEAGFLQRIRALNAFVLDVYSDQRAFADGVLPERLATSSEGFEPAMRGLLDDSFPPIGLAGFDIVRSPTGELMVLEDNLRMPSGLTYATTIRDAVAETADWQTTPRPIDGFARGFGDCLRAAVDAVDGSGIAALLSEGEGSVAWSEHQLLAEEMDVSIVTPQDLSTSRGRLHARIGPRHARIDVLYRRLDDERLTAPDGEPTELGELLLPALRSGRLRCVNAFGTGIADDKLSHAYSERMIAHYLGEEPILRSVPAYDLADHDDRARTMGRLEEMVIKPRGGFGGSGVVLLPKTTEGARREAIGRVRRSPEQFVAQEMLQLSAHPTICGDRLRPRHVDLRPFVATDGSATHVLPGGLTRFALGAGDMVVNSSRGGGGKDTWVVDS